MSDSDIGKQITKNTKHFAWSFLAVGFNIGKLLILFSNILTITCNFNFYLKYLLNYFQSKEYEVIIPTKHKFYRTTKQHVECLTLIFRNT